MRLASVVLLAFAALLVTEVRAQNVSCALTGVVQAWNGSPMPALQVTLTTADTGFVRTTTTNHEGFFSYPDLSPGTFSIQITAPGFRSYREQGIEITSGEHRALGNIRLQLGTVLEQVTVTADAAVVNLASGEKSAVLTGSEIERMALRGRDIFDAIGLLPGVIDTSQNREAPGHSSIGNIYILGGRNNSKNMTIDGVTNLDTGSNGSVHTMPSMDAVAEVKVLVSNYAAEYGRNAGGSVSVITRGGSKTFHGSGGFYWRNEALNANDYFNNAFSLPRSEYRYSIASYTIGGPVILPRINRERSNLFFFFSQEFDNQKYPYGQKKVTVPTALERQGDFSQTFDVNAKLITVKDPLNALKQFPGNRIPAFRLTPEGRAILGLFPMPNFTDPNPTNRYQWNYISDVSASYPRRSEIGRVDWSPRPNWQMYGRVSHDNEEQHVPYGLWVAGSLNYPLTPIVFQTPGRGAVLHSTNVITPSMYNEFIFGVSQNKLYYFPEYPDRVNRGVLRIDLPQFNSSLNPQGYIPNMTFSSVQNYANPSLSDGTPYYNSNTIFNVVENVSKIWNTHQIKFGFYFERTRKDESANAATRGTLKFDRDSNNPLDTNYAYSNALLGYYDSYSEATSRPQGQYRFSNIELYAQDSWRASSRLSLEYGVRIYHDPPQYDARSQLASFVPSLYDPAQAPVLFRPGFDASGKKAAIDPVSGRIYNAGLIGTYVPEIGNPAEGEVIGGKNGVPPGLYSTPEFSLAPRVGFAWDPFGSGKTAIRGGAGVFFDRIQGNPSMGLIQNPPTIYTPTVYYGTIADLRQAANSGLLAPSSTVTTLIGHQPLPTVYNFSFGVQRQIGHNSVIDLSYAGSLSRHFLWERNINPVPLGARFVDQHPENRDLTANNTTTALPPNFLRPYQGLGDIFLFEFGATGNYNALLASFAQRFSHGLDFGISYTFGKALGTASSDTDKVDPVARPRDRNYGLLTYDRTQVFSMRYNYRLPRPGHALNNGALSAIADNWQLAGITRIMSGAPFTPGYSLVSSYDVTGSPSITARVDVLDPRAPANVRFGPPVKGTVGDAGINILRGPGTNNWDISLYRRFRFADRLETQLRLETYNTFNHTQFSGLYTTAKFDKTGAQVDPLFLTPNAARSARRLQLGIRVNW